MTAMTRTAADAGVRAYVDALPPEARAAVARLRALIRAAAPKAVESRSYGILGYKVDGRPFVYCGGFQKHVAMYPVTAAAVIRTAAHSQSATSPTPKAR